MLLRPRVSLQLQRRLLAMIVTMMVPMSLRKRSSKEMAKALAGAGKTKARGNSRAKARIKARIKARARAKVRTKAKRARRDIELCGPPRWLLPLMKGFNCIECPGISQALKEENKYNCQACHQICRQLQQICVGALVM